jgi:hypothetical protein
MNATTAQFGAFVSGEIGKWGKIVKWAALTAD